jgi:uncharacterized membrane protein YphA (DoxX/SURF4 family)
MTQHFPDMSLPRFGISRESDLGGWVLRSGVAFFMVMAGSEKFASPPSYWIGFFEHLGFGQWFRYFTGIVEIVGALLYIFPVTCPIGAGMLACTMVGAMLAHIVFYHSIGNAIYPLLILIAIVTVAVRQPDKPIDALTRRPRPPSQ